MRESRLELKRASGWFAAGAEVLQAATLLSDRAFKLFVWICLHAQRNSGRLPYTFIDLARVLHKTEHEIRASLNELHQAGFCRFTTALVESRTATGHINAPHPGLSPTILKPMSPLSVGCFSATLVSGVRFHRPTSD